MQKYTASVITAGCLWGLMGLFTRTLATYGVDSTGAIVLRCGIAALLFAVTLLVRDPKQFRIRLKTSGALSAPASAACCFSRIVIFRPSRSWTCPRRRCCCTLRRRSS